MAGLFQAGHVSYPNDADHWSSNPRFWAEPPLAIDALFVGYRRHVLEPVSEEVPLTGVHALEAGQLEWEHRDPFDRLIAAQAIVEGFTIITADQALQDFALVDTLW